MLFENEKAPRSEELFVYLENGVRNDFYFEPNLFVEELFKFYELRKIS
jgi:hypothetical protein